MYGHLDLSVYLYMFVHDCTGMYPFVHESICVCVIVHAYIGMFVCEHMHVFVSVCECVFVYEYVHTCVHLVSMYVIVYIGDYVPYLSRFYDLSAVHLELESNPNCLDSF